MSASPTDAQALTLWPASAPLPSTTSLPLPCRWCGEVTVSRDDATDVPEHPWCRPRDAGLTDPETSQKASKSARKGSGSLLARAILAELHGRPDGATDDELRDVFPEAPPGSVSKRRGDLCRDRLARDSGRTRPSRYGRASIVWEAMPT